MKQNDRYPKTIIHRLGGPSASRPSYSSWLLRALVATLLFVAATSVSRATPFTLRTLPAGFDKTATPNGSAGPVMNPIAADFMGDGTMHWYQGGNVISRFPVGGNITLPAITLPQTPTATVRPLTATVCDVDRDGDMDIVRINEWNGNLFLYTLQIFLNNGSGTFSLGYRLDWTDNPSWNEGEHYFSIVPADFNKDGAPDLAILGTYQNRNEGPDPDREAGQFYIRWNDGTGSFLSTITMIQPTGLSAACRISSADYDRDGDPDLYCNLYTTYGEDPLPFQDQDVFYRSLLFTNDGTGAFASGSNFSNLRPGRLQDVNGDGWADLIGNNANIASNQTLALNDGAGNFGGLQDPTPPSYTIPIGDLSVFASFRNEVLPRVVYVEPGLIHVSGNNGTLLTAGPAVANTSVTGIGAADSDGDGDTDIFVSLFGGGFAFLENRELHTIPRAELRFRSAFSGITALHSADFDLDGREDLLAVTPAQKKLWFIPTQFTGTPDTPIFKSTQNEIPGGVAVADFDQDGRPDVAYTLPTAGSVRLVRNSAITPALWADSAIATGQTGVSLLATGEYGSKNGRPDLFTVNGTTGQVRGLYQSGSTWVGQTIATAVSPVPQALAVGQGSNAPGDELAYLSIDASNLNLRGSHLNSGWNALGSGRTDAVTGGPYPAKVVWGDATGDSRFKEAFYINSNGGLSAWLPMVFSISNNLGSAPSPIRDIAAVDWDQDGRTDVLAATDSGLSLFHYQRGSQQWTRTDLYSPPTGGYNALTITDLNHDGYPDVVAAHSAGYLDYIDNTRYQVATDFSAMPLEVNGPAGQTVIAMEFPITNAALPAANGGLEDIAMALQSLSVEFEAALPGPNGTWIAGSMGTGLLMNYVSKVKFSVNGVLMDSETIVGGSSNSIITMSKSGTAPLSTLSTPGAPMQVRVELEMAPAAQQTTTRFFVKIIGTSSLPLVLIDKTTYEVSAAVTDNLMIANNPVLVTYVPPPTALQQWRHTNFGTYDGTGNAANDADADGDGNSNIVEYIMGQNPKVAGGIGSSLPVGLTVGGLNTNVIADLRLLTTYDSKIRLTLQESTNLTGWNTLSSRTGTGPWVGTTPATSLLNGGRTRFEFNTGVKPASSRKYFLRLKVEELP